MKISFTILFCCLLTGLSFGQTGANENPLATVQSAGKLFQTVESDIANAINAQITNRLVTTKELAAILSVLDAAAGKVRESAYEKRLVHAAEQIELVRNQTAGAFKDATSKEVMSLEMLSREWLTQIDRITTSESILLSRIAELHSITDELVKAVTIMQTVVPPEQISDRLKTRLAQLATEWQLQPKEGGRHATGNNSENSASKEQAGAGSTPSTDVILGTSRTEGNAGSKQNSPRPRRQRVVEVSHATYGLIQLAQRGASERALLQSVANCPWPYDLTNDQIISFREDSTLSPAVTAAMLKHDAAFYPKAQ